MDSLDDLEPETRQNIMGFTSQFSPENEEADKFVNCKETARIFVHLETLGYLDYLDRLRGAFEVGF